MSTSVAQVGSFIFKVHVFDDHIEWKLGIDNVSIPLSQISSIGTASMLSAKMKVETTGGKTYIIPLPPKHQKELKDIITELQNKQGSGVMPAAQSESDEIAKLASLRDSGILTEDEFQAKKRQILGL